MGTATLRIDFNYYRPYSMRTSEGRQELIKIENYHSINEIKRQLRDYFESWSGRGEITLNWVEPCGYYDVWPAQETLNKHLMNKSYKFNNLSR